MYRLYIDETGNADLQASRDPNHRYLSLTGVIVHRDHVTLALTPRLNELKNEIFRPDPDEPIIFHRKDIIQRNRPFHVLRDTELAKTFDEKLLTLLDECDFGAITVVMDKLEHLQRYNVWRYNPYHYCLEVLLERYVLWLKRHGAKGDVMGEVRGKYFDSRLEKAFAHLHKHGTSFVRRDVMQRHLTSNKIKLKTKVKNISGLQIADLLAHPSALYVRSEYTGNIQVRGFGAHIVNMLTRAKYHPKPQGIIRGWGIKWLP